MWLVTSYRGRGLGGPGNNGQAVNLFYRSETERQMYFKEFSLHVKRILRLQSDATVPDRVFAELRRRRGPIQRTLQSIPGFRRIFG